MNQKRDLAKKKYLSIVNLTQYSEIVCPQILAQKIKMTELNNSTLNSNQISLWKILREKQY